MGCSYFNLGDVDFNNSLNINKSEGAREARTSPTTNRKHKPTTAATTVRDDDDYYMDRELKGRTLRGRIAGTHIWFCIMSLGCDAASTRPLQGGWNPVTCVSHAGTHLKNAAARGRVRFTATHRVVSVAWSCLFLYSSDQVSEKNCSLFHRGLSGGVTMSLRTPLHLL